MDEFCFSETDKMLRRQVQEFAKRELVPGTRERSLADHFPRDLIAKIAELGYLGLVAPPEYGGQGLGLTEVGIVVEELGRVDIVCPHVLLSPIQMTLLLQKGTVEQQQKWMAPTIRGENIYSLCLSESDCGTDAAAIKTRAVRKGNSYILRGEKQPVSRGMQADVFIVFAKTDPAAGAKGVSCFLVPGDLPGISRSPIEHMGMEPFRAAAVNFDDVEVPAENRLGDEGRGFYLVMGSFELVRVIVCLVALAQAQTSLDETITYSKERRAFGNPIAKYEAISFKIAEDLTLLQAARLLCYHALWAGDQGMTATKEAAMCKWYVPQIAVKVVHDCMLIQGHVGYSKDSPLEKRMRDCLGYEITDGTAEAQLLTIVREVMGREFRPY